MGRNGRYDVGQIDGSENMSAEEKAYFGKFWTAMNEQAEMIAEENEVDPKQQQEYFDYIMDSLVNDMTEYIVDGAPLQCSMQADTDNIQKLTYKGREIISKPAEVEEMSVLKLPKDRKENINGLVYANIYDTAGGLMDEKLIIRTEKKGKEKEVNIASFGNCKWIEEDNIVKIENMVENIFRILKGIYYKGRPHFTREEIAEKVIEALEQGKGTCYCYMALNSMWENLPAGYDFADNSYHYEFTSVGFDGNTYMQFDGKEGINKMSMLFCRHGGIICAKESGQDKTLSADIFTALEKTLLAKYNSDFAYANWSLEKKYCAREIWNRFYIEEGYDAYFVAGLIGNMFAEGYSGLLEDKAGWGQFLDEKGNAICVRNTPITNIRQAEVACLKASGDFGVGMMQWSYSGRKEKLFLNYQNYQSDNGALSMDQLMKAELDTIYMELNDQYFYKRIISPYEEYANANDNAGDNITCAACILIREYETPQGYDKVDAQTFEVAQDVWNDSKNATKIDDVHTICQRIIASKVIYEEFMY